MKDRWTPSFAKNPLYLSSKSGCFITYPSCFNKNDLAALLTRFRVFSILCVLFENLQVRLGNISEKIMEQPGNISIIKLEKATFISYISLPEGSYPTSFAPQWIRIISGMPERLTIHKIIFMRCFHFIPPMPIHVML